MDVSWIVKRYQPAPEGAKEANLSDKRIKEMVFPIFFVKKCLEYVVKWERDADPGFVTPPKSQSQITRLDNACSVILNIKPENRIKNIRSLDITCFQLTYMFENRDITFMLQSAYNLIQFLTGDDLWICPDRSVEKFYSVMGEIAYYLEAFTDVDGIHKSANKKARKVLKELQDKKGFYNGK